VNRPGLERSQDGAAAAPVTVVLPTIGRPELVRSCLDSLASCQPRAGEILVINSSQDDDITDVVAGFSGAGARRIGCQTLGLGSAFSLGLQRRSMRSFS
jgi:glycosyltransferase involved in cell wall biosynthesis